ncbi:MAG TPA: hypothetical protein VL598_02835 [Trinickia sp.]|jgi:hypothetical protein|uniref:hypothetical protein n=1 Tax=Trinickia sp. TaxID=2571163 RepID=UPI002C5E54AD|nr:hypothetical protein [Trinickia sp.]HTI16582.1 hypothetical protein [Trinickia sp.]
MKKLLIATLIGSIAATMSLAANAQTTQPAAPAHASAAHAKQPVHKKTAKAPAPKHRLVKRKSEESVAKMDPVPEGAVRYTCSEGHSFELKGDMSRDQIVTVHWANKNYSLPRESTTTGAQRFHDAASGLDLVVIPTKVMLFSDSDSSRLADECKTAEMAQGGAATTQSSALKGQ